MNEELKEDLYLLAYGIFLFSITLGIAFGVTATIGAISCNATWSNSGYEHSFGPLKGCVIRVNGRWIPAKNHREIGK